MLIGISGTRNSQGIQHLVAIKATKAVYVRNKGITLPCSIQVEVKELFTLK